ncbi:MAG: hypothetical protein HYY84_02750 [Deltaproteobacteria bacterium]|nr:hypothetical protein [Deltaproteobacteria bacterium]
MKTKWIQGVGCLIAFAGVFLLLPPPTATHRPFSIINSARADQPAVEPSLWEKAKQKLGSAYSRAVDSVKSIWERGPAYAKTQFKEIWAGIKSLDCLKVVDGFSGFDPTVMVLDRLWAPSGTCVREFRKGFICAIPYLVGEVARLGIATIKTAWAHRSECFKAAVLTGPLATGGFAACGLYYYIKENLAKATACLRSMKGNQIWKLLWESAWKLGCWIAGELVADILLETLSGGSGTPALIAKWAKKISTLLPTSEWLGLGKAAARLGPKGVEALVWTADSAAYYVRDVAGGLVECGGTSAAKPSPVAAARTTAPASAPAPATAPTTGSSTAARVFNAVGYAGCLTKCCLLSPLQCSKQRDPVDLNTCTAACDKNYGYSSAVTFNKARALSCIVGCCVESPLQCSGARDPNNDFNPCVKTCK